MKKKTRLIILLACVVLFLVIAPYIVLYSLGYRVDFAHYKITATGGIYVRVYPTGADVKIDNTNKETTSYFYSSVFVQNLTPGTHQVSVTKDGYYDYAKSLTVAENEVTKLENITLFKKNITFTALADIPATASEPAITAQAQFATLTKKTAITAPLIKNLIAFESNGETIIYLATDGFLYATNINEKTTTKVTLVPVAIQKTATYKISILAGNTYLQQDHILLTLDAKTQSFKTISTAVNDIALSPDNQKLAYYNANEIDYITPNVADSKPVVLRKSSSPISQVAWLNNDYIIFSEGNNIIISEIDVRGNINTVTLPTTITLGTQAIIMKSPQFFFNQQDKKLYLLTQNNLVVSDRLLP